MVNFLIFFFRAAAGREIVDEGPVALDFTKVKHDMAFAADRRKCLLLQSLRWVSRRGLQFNPDPTTFVLS